MYSLIYNLLVGTVLEKQHDKTDRFCLKKRKVRFIKHNCNIFQCKRIKLDINNIIGWIIEDFVTSILNDLKWFAGSNSFEHEHALETQTRKFVNSVFRNFMTFF